MIEFYRKTSWCKSNMLYIILHKVYFQQLIPIFFFFLCICCQAASSSYSEDLWCHLQWDGNWVCIIYKSMCSLSLRNDTTEQIELFPRKLHQKTPDPSLSTEGRSFLPISLCVCYIGFTFPNIITPQLHLLFLQFLRPSLSVLSLITESGKPFSLPSINISAFIFVTVSLSEQWYSFMMSKHGPEWQNLHTKWKFSQPGRHRVSSSSQLFPCYNELHIVLLPCEYTKSFSFLVSDPKKKRV